MTTRLLGGLGNQLFSYFAGASLAGRLNVSLVVDPSWVRFGMTDHGIEIEKFDLPGTWLSERRLHAWERPGSLSSRAVNKAVRQSQAIGRLLGRYDSDVVGFDPGLLRRRRPAVISGYYQSWRYPESATRYGYPRRPHLKAPSHWLDDLVEEAKAKRPIALHVRRGDYEHVPTFGLLSSNYYRKALVRLREQGLDGPIWLFTDEPSRVQSEFQDLNFDRLVQSPDGPAVEMLAMSYAAAVVTGNSTFSWWAAWMSGLSQEVVSPMPWFRSRGEIPDLIPPRWQRVEASWT